MIDIGKDLQQAFEDGYKKGFADGQSQQGIEKDRLVELLKNKIESADGWKDYQLAFKDLLAWVNQQPTTDGWIPCSERLPSRSNEYWATIKIRGNYYVRKVDFNSSIKKWHGWVRDGDEVIAWQEEVIPQPYKESENNV